MPTPTRYEITLRNTADGRVFLLAYAGGTPSRRRLLSALQSRADAFIALTEMGESDEIHFTTRPRPAGSMGEWWVGFTGRTQRDAKTEGEHTFILDAEEAA